MGVSDLSWCGNRMLHKRTDVYQCTHIGKFAKRLRLMDNTMSIDALSSEIGHLADYGVSSLGWFVGLEYT
jgi:hypothetical protein